MDLKEASSHYVDTGLSSSHRKNGKIDDNRVRYLTQDECQRLSVALPAWLRPIVILAKNTGLRRGNLLQLTWQDVDLNRKVLVVSKTKNGDPIGIPLTDTAARTLAENLREAVKVLDKRESGYILVTVGEKESGALAVPH